jgi:hypothetical protein
MRFEIISYRQAKEILESKRTIFKEIKDVISNLTLKPEDRFDHETIKEGFKNKKWDTEEKIAEGLAKKWRYDAFKQRVAIEIDTNTPCYRSFLKFILGYNRNKIDVGVIIVWDVKNIRHHKYHRFEVT